MQSAEPAKGSRAEAGRAFVRTCGPRGHTFWGKGLISPPPAPAHHTQQGGSSQVSVSSPHKVNKSFIIALGVEGQDFASGTALSWLHS